MIVGLAAFPADVELDTDPPPRPGRVGKIAGLLSVNGLATLRAAPNDRPLGILDVEPLVVPSDEPLGVLSDRPLGVGADRDTLPGPTEGVELNDSDRVVDGVESVPPPDPDRMPEPNDLVRNEFSGGADRNVLESPIVPAEPNRAPNDRLLLLPN